MTDKDPGLKVWICVSRTGENGDRCGYVQLWRVWKMGES
jgi:hypothetical protein